MSGGEAIRLGTRGETTTQTGSEGVITLTTNSTDGVLSLAVDAPREARPAVWVDLNGDGNEPKTTPKM